MSSAYLICMGIKGPADPAENTRAHEQLLAELNAEAERLRWDGTDIAFYRRKDGWVSISVAPGDLPATLEDLRLFRQAQREVEAANQDQPAQKGLFS